MALRRTMTVSITCQMAAGRTGAVGGRGDRIKTRGAETSAAVRNTTPRTVRETKKKFPKKIFTLFEQSRSSHGTENAVLCSVAAVIAALAAGRSRNGRRFQPRFDLRTPRLSYRRQRLTSQHVIVQTRRRNNTISRRAVFHGYFLFTVQ